MQIQPNVNLLLKKGNLQRPLNVLALLPNELVRRVYAKFKQYVGEESLTILNNETKRILNSEELIVKYSQIDREATSKSGQSMVEISTNNATPSSVINNTSRSNDKIFEIPTSTEGRLKTPLLQKKDIPASNSTINDRRKRTLNRKKFNKNEKSVGLLKKETKEEKLFTLSSKENILSGSLNTEVNDKSPKAVAAKSLPPLYGSLSKNDPTKGAMLEYYGNSSSKVKETPQLEKSPPRYGDLMPFPLPNPSDDIKEKTLPEKVLNTIVEIEPIGRDNDNNSFAVPCVNGCLIPLPDGMDEYNRIRCKKCKGKLSISM